MGLDMFLMRGPKNVDDESLWDKAKEVGYWRKANHIHAWFVDNCQDGIDECQTTEVDKEKLEELFSICRTIINPGGGSVPLIEKESIAQEKLPTRQGFFFGGTEYDQYYYEDVDETMNILEKVLAETDFENESIYYSASW